LNCGEEVSCEFIVSCGDCPEMFEFVEEALDEVALGVEREVARACDFAIGLSGNHGGDVSPDKGLDQHVGVVSLVPDQRLRLDIVKQRPRAGQIVSLAWREPQRNGVAEGIDERMDFGGQSAAESTDRVFAVFFRAPALCW
jgi:hypothetical protein